ncbi:YwmB family TATA-box binding protein [Paenibacillus solisilvae]|uniref:YwmB family TATA-box binding protein n=1 Tax=Paenibacillus solisilvae TaxID=2486751 RepID=A0ABW0W4Z8_9BACL
MNPSTSKGMSISKKRSNWNGIAAACLILLITVGWTLWHVRTNSVSASSPLQKDFSVIWSWSTQVLAGGAIDARWSFRWDGRLKGSEAAKLAANWGILLKKASTGTFDGETNEADGYNKLTVWIHQPLQAGTLPDDTLGDADVDLVMLLEPGAGLPFDSIKASIVEIEQVIKAADESITGSFSVRGIPVEADAAERIAHDAAAKQQENYEDGHTSSITYWSPKLTTEVKSGTKRVNLQIAETGPAPGAAAELIIGVPLITGDYTVED